MTSGPGITLDPDELDEFVNELRTAGFVAVDDDGRSFRGPLPHSLTEFTSATEMTITIADPWPYRQPHVIVYGIDWWHAAHDMPCLWQIGDNTKRWVTLRGLLARIDEWADHAKRGFTAIEGVALDPHLYFEHRASHWAAIDIDALIGGLKQDGQHDLIHLDPVTDEFAIVEAGMGAGRKLWGRWFYRISISSPPRDLASFERLLTKNQRAKLDKILGSLGKGLFALAWPTVHGTACLVLVITQHADGTRDAVATSPTPLSQRDRLRRGGPDSATLRTKRVVLFGAGAIGSNVGSILSRSGLGQLVVVDGDIKLPVGLVRHAGPAVGVGKADEMRDLLAPFEWTTVEPIPQSSWDPETLRNIIRRAALCIDATGLTPFAELLSRIAAQLDVPMITAALYRGGRVVRIRRQARDDCPIVHRTCHWRYPTIPTGADPAADFVGAETGCAAPIHNAPPAAVAVAAALTVIVGVDFLTGRMDYPDEIIEVLEPIEAPFETLGRHSPRPALVMLADEARSAMVAAAGKLHPCETGGILIGLLDDTHTPCITQAVEFRPATPSPHRYRVPQGLTTAAVDSARETDKRLVYLGEWHSHPTDQPASRTDRTTMADLAANPDTGDPLLCVLRPTARDQFTIDAYMCVNQNLARVPVVDVGPIATEEQP